MTPVRHASSRALLWLVALGVFMQMLDSTIVNTALPAMAASLGESPLRMQSVVIAYALTMATLIPASGWLADRFGTRRVFFFAVAVFTLGSLLCAARTRSSSSSPRASCRASVVRCCCRSDVSPCCVQCRARIFSPR
jgi:predicted MFS family arabinose efflux permease